MSENVESDSQGSLYSAPAPRPFWLMGIAYFGAFVLGAFIDIIRHSYDRILPAIQSDTVNDAIIQRGLIAVALAIIVIAGLYFGSRWAGSRFGIGHRSALQALFLLTPIGVYILDH